MRLIYFFILFIPTMLLSQTQTKHFTYVKNLTNMAHIGIQTNINPNVDGVNLVTEDEIGVFNTKGVCCGAVVWEEQVTALIAYGAENSASSNIGFTENEAMVFRIWVKKTNKEYEATATYYSGNPYSSTKYVSGGIYLLLSLKATTTSNPPNPNDILTPSLPDQINISQNYPNPFNPSTKIEISFPHSGNFVFDIYDINGKLIKNLNNSFVTPGNYLFEWDGKDNNKMRVSSGIYFYRIKYFDKNYTGKMVLEK